MEIVLTNTRNITADQILPLYEANEWSAAQKPDLLLKGVINSHSLITAWDGNILVGLGNAISDGHLVVYYSHLLVLPYYQGKVIGHLIMDKMQQIYKDFHMQMNKVAITQMSSIFFWGRCVNLIFLKRPDFSPGLTPLYSHAEIWQDWLTKFPVTSSFWIPTNEDIVLLEIEG